MDLVSNGFNREESEKLAETLKKNHTMYGFHFEGNVGFTDEKMFLRIPTEEQPKENNILKKRIQGVQCQRKQNLSKYEKNLLFSNCWICEGWQPCKFTWKPGTLLAIMRADSHRYFWED